MKSTLVASKTLLACLFFTSILLAVARNSYGQDVLYGMTQYGGMYNKGVPYQINVDGTNFFSFRDFDGIEWGYPGDGARFSQLYQRDTGLGIVINAGNFVGLTMSGYLNTGFGNRLNISAGKSGATAFSIFKVTTATGTNPSGGFLTTPNGKLYGLMSANGKYGGGTLFSSVDLLNPTSTVLASFEGVNTGRSPRGTPVKGRDGKLYGTTEYGGLQDLGVIFSFDIIKAQELVKLIDFDGVAKGANPTGSLVLASDGRLYGMTKNGGVYGHGVIFSILQDGSGYIKLLDFNGSATGSHPRGSLTQFTDGNLYGMTYSGGANGFGTIFRISLNGAFDKIIDFDGNNGKFPVGDLLVDTRGTMMYGTTYAGGSNDSGVLFKLQNGNQFTKLYDYNLATGSNPVGALMMSRKQFRMRVESIPDQIVDSAPITPTINSEIDLPVYFSSSDTSVIAVRNAQLVFKSSGSSLITAFQPGNHEYLANSSSVTVQVKKKSQAIAFSSLPAKTFGDAPFTVSASASSGLSVALYSSNPSVATVDGNKITIKGAGHVTITARQPGDERYESASAADQHLFVERAVQIITFNPPSIRTCCDFFSLTATSSAGLKVLFKSSDLMKLSILESLAQPVDVGTVDIIAYHPGSTNYKPVEKRASIEIRKGFQTLVFHVNNAPHKVGDPPDYSSYGSSSSLPVTLVSDPPGIAVVEKGYLHFLAEGTTTITATQSGNSRYYPAPSVSRTITVGAPVTPGVGNAISFPDLAEKTVVDPPFNLTANATSGLPVSYTSSNPSVAEVSGNLVTIKGIGTTKITASQAGKDGVAPATPIVKELRVGKRSQYIPFSLTSSEMYGILPIELPTTTHEGLPISYVLSDNSLGSIENYYLTIKGDGNLTITASQPGNDLYLAAPSVSETITIYPIYDGIYLKPLPELTYGDEPFDLEAWTTSGLPVTFSSSDENIASVKGSKVTINAAGKVTFFAKSINAGYRLTQLQEIVTIHKLRQTITFVPPEPKKFGDTPFLLSASSTSDLPVSFVTSTPGIVRIDGRRVTIVGNGMAEIAAIQAGNSNYESAETLVHKFMVTDVGNVYELVGATTNGGPNHSGVLFSMNSEGTSFEYLKQFGAKTSPSPRAGFIKGVDGRLYGTFPKGGTGNVGSIVVLQDDGTGFTYLHHFRGIEGEQPAGNLIQAMDGYLYGTTQRGGMLDGGTIFRIKPDGTEFNVIYNFSELTGSFPNNIIQGSDGKLYGITQAGGFYRYGTIFSVNTDGSEFSIIFHQNDNAPIKSGSSPRGGLVQGSDGFLYGINAYGGDNGYGTLFKIKMDGSGFTKIVQFNGTTTGGVPGYEILFGSDGRIYGMTAAGGTHQQGTIFAVNRDGTNFVQLFSFEDTDSESSPLGSNPFGKLSEGSDGFLYGTTAKGGNNNNGIIFRINKDGSGFQTMVHLDKRASSPSYGPLVESTPGVFFGMASSGGSMNGGAIFKVTADAEFSIISDFPQEQTTPKDLIADQTGEYYYGITQANTDIEGGSIFRVNAAGSSYDQIYDVPLGEIITTIFYSSTNHVWVSGIHNGENFMFRMRPDGSEREDILSYNSALSGQRLPVTTMVETSHGEIFGATSALWSGASIFFKIKNDGTGFNKILDLGGQLTTDLVYGSDGNFYIAYGKEGIFKITPSGSISNIFVHPYPNDGPEIKKIIEMNGGRLAAVTRLSGSGGVTGARNFGTIFSVEKDGTDYNEIYAFLSREVTSPVDMVQSMDGWLYVVSTHGGVNGKGLVYKLRPDGFSFTKVKEFNGDDGENPNGIFFRRAVQSFSFDPLPEKKTSDPAFLPTIVTTSGSPVTLSSSNPTVAVIENGQIKPVGSGTTMIMATLSANANFYEGGQMQRQLIVTKGGQTIIFNKLPPANLQDITIELTAVSTAGLPVSYESSNSSVASVSGSTVTIHAVGSTTITASQAGNDNFFPASDVSQVLVIHDRTQTIAFSNPGSKVLGNPPFFLTAESSSGLEVVYVTTSDKISIAGSRVTILKAGMVTIQAHQAGSDDFEPAPPVEVSFCINPPKPIITETGQIPDVELSSSNDIGNQWFLDNDVLAGYVSQSIMAMDEGSYTVTTTIDDCESERSAPMVFITTSIEEVLTQVNLYPNPATQIINVEIPDNISGIARVELYDVTGRLLESREIPTGSTGVFDLKEHRHGMLLMKIFLNEKIIVKKILSY